MFREDPPQREAQVEALGLSLMKINFFPLSPSLVVSPIHHELTFITLRSRLIFFIHDFLRLLPRQSLSLAARNFPLWYHYFSYSKQTQKNQKNVPSFFHAFIISLSSAFAHCLSFVSFYDIGLLLEDEQLWRILTTNLRPTINSYLTCQKDDKRFSLIRKRSSFALFFMCHIMHAWKIQRKFAKWEN